MQRIGVFVCWCGSNIAATVDVQAVAEAMKREPGVVYAANYQYMCSEGGQKLISDAIHEYNLTGVVICSCSPRMHGHPRRAAAEGARASGGRPVHGASHRARVRREDHP